MEDLFNLNLRPFHGKGRAQQAICPQGYIFQLKYSRWLTSICIRLRSLWITIINILIIIIFCMYLPDKCQFNRFSSWLAKSNSLQPFTCCANYGSSSQQLASNGNNIIQHEAPKTMGTCWKCCFSIPLPGKCFVDDWFWSIRAIGALQRFRIRCSAAHNAYQEGVWVPFFACSTPSCSIHSAVIAAIIMPNGVDTGNEMIDGGGVGG